MKPAITQLATCYNPTAEPGSRWVYALYRDNQSSSPFGAYVLAEIHNGACVWETRKPTEAEALKHAADLGYTDVVRRDERGDYKPTIERSVDKPLTVVEWETLHTLCEEDAERLEARGSKYTARNMRELTERIKARLDAAREGRVMP